MKIKEMVKLGLFIGSMAICLYIGTCIPTNPNLDTLEKIKIVNVSNDTVSLEFEKNIYDFKYFRN